MDIQLKRGLLDVCVLAAIKQEDSYGYKIIKGHEAVCGAFRIDPIPHSAKIEAAQLLSVHSAEHNGRLRKYYHTRNRDKSGLNISKPEWNEIRFHLRICDKGGQKQCVKKNF